MGFTEITLEHKGLLDTYFKSYDPETSELTFTNLFMWRHCNKYSFIEESGFLCIIANPAEGQLYAFFPIPGNGASFDKDGINGLKSAFGAISAHFKDTGKRLVFGRVTEKECSIFKEIRDDISDIIPDRNNSDYLYKCEDLRMLAGKRFDGKRNHISRFKKENEYKYVRIEKDILPECANIMDKWCSLRNCSEDNSLYCERTAVNELLSNYDTLGCIGAAIEVNGNFEAFTIGEMLNWNTAVIHVEKANSSINGLYAAINQEFCANEWQDAIYINREQDLGIEGIRKAKLSYNPVALISKYTVTF